MSETAWEVALSTPPYTVYHYKAPVGNNNSLLGCAVKVPFGHQKPQLGWVWRESIPPAGIPLKPIHSIESNGSLFPAELLSFLHWFADYYRVPPGIAIQTALPPNDYSGTKTLRLEQWSKLGSAELPPAKGKLPRGFTELYNDLTSLPDWLPLKERIERTSASPAAVTRLEKAGIVIIERRPPWHRDPALSGIAPHNAGLPPLTSEQQSAVTRLLELFSTSEFHSILLYGVTSSGKTRVYLEIAQAAIKAGKSVLVIVPEIAMTPQLIGTFRALFGSLVRVLHSAMTDTARRGTYAELRTGGTFVVIGARSALFAPVANLGLVVVDEEHESSLKQNDSEPRYHARDSALVRAKLANCLAILGSASPSIEIFYGALNGKHELIELPNRVDNIPLPDIRIVDMNNVPMKDPGRQEVFSPELIEAIQDRLDRKEQVILLRNRRGYGTHLRCGKCNWVMGCPNCSVTLTVHRERNGMLCHLCGYFEQFPERCPNCGSARIVPRGFGTERVEEALSESIPAVRILRMDADSVRERGSHQRILQDFVSYRADVLLGTRMVARSLDFPRVTLVGILSADSEWILPDFRSEERALSLLLQAAGRAGRRERGEVFVQTWDPGHHLFEFLLHHDWTSFANYTLALRKRLGFPPFVRLVRILVTAPEERIASDEALRLQKWLVSQNVNTSDSAPALISRRESTYRYAILLRFSLSDPLRKVLETLPKPLHIETRIAIDIDPIDFN